MTRWTSAQIADALLKERRVLRSLARRLAGDADLAGDAVVEAATGHAAPPRSMRAFLTAIVRRRAHNLRRDAARRARRERAAARAERVPSADEMAARREVCQRVGDAVLRLDEPYRTTVWLRYFEGLPPRAIAARMRVSVATVRSRHARALALLRGALDREFGDRRKWCIALVPWLGGGALRTTLLAALVPLQRLTLAGVVLLGVFAVALWAWPAETRSPPRASPVPESAPAAHVVASEIRRESEPAVSAATQERSDEPALVRGRLEYDHGTPAAGLSFWLWGEGRPEWTEPSAQPRAKDLDWGELPSFDGETDADGRFAAAPSYPVVAITFRVDDTIYVTYETKRPRATRVLPRLGTVTAQLVGWRPGDEWRVNLWAGVGESFPTMSTRLCTTASGDAVLTLRAPEAGVTVRAESAQLRAVAGVPYELNHDDDLIDLVPGRWTVWCGDTVSFRIAERLPSFTVCLREPGGELSTQTPGIVVHHSRERRSCWTRRLAEGCASLRAWPDRPLVSLVTSEGEVFRADAPVEIAAGEHPRVDFVRGEGMAAWRFSVPPEMVLDDVAEVRVETAGSWRIAEPWQKQTFMEANGSEEEATWWALPDGTLGVLRPGALEARVRVFLRDGRCGEGRWRGTDARAARPLPLHLQPSEALAPIDLRALAAERGARRGRFAWVVRLPGERATREWHGHFVDTFELRPWTREWPIWTKQCPSGGHVELFFWDFEQKSEYLVPPFTRRGHR
jgi:RNA polymerase sigma factor (sigma-70 family)